MIKLDGVGLVEVDSKVGGNILHGLETGGSVEGGAKSDEREKPEDRKQDMKWLHLISF